MDKCRAEFEKWRAGLKNQYACTDMLSGFNAAWQAQEARIAKLREALQVIAQSRRGNGPKQRRKEIWEVTIADQALAEDGK